jgi:hypothetical protein
VFCKGFQSSSAITLSVPIQVVDGVVLVELSLSTVTIIGLLGEIKKMKEKD